MKIVQIVSLARSGPFVESETWQKIQGDLLVGIKAVVWPKGSKRFTIHPQSGKRRGEGNGVKPIKDGLIKRLTKSGWVKEISVDLGVTPNPGKFDAVLKSADHKPVVFEWETGNISSSHRALNKMALGLHKGKLAAGVLVVPSRRFCVYLTDRIGNFEELAPYLSLWRSVPYPEGAGLEIVVIEQDAESLKVPRIPKGTDGRSAL
jgi:Restriction endonuclease BamHI